MSRNTVRIVLLLVVCVCLSLLAACDDTEMLEGTATDTDNEEKTVRTETSPTDIEAELEPAYVRDGNYIYFGEYPQTIKADDVEINDETDKRGYYLGSDGEYYAKITSTPYYSDYTFSTGASVTSGEVYYFKVEPIKWRILSEDEETAFILCDSVIAHCAFDEDSNNYAESDIRAWLNNEFYNTAFSALQQKIILTTTVDNSAESTGYTNNKYASENTKDKVFLLSYAEIINSDYGFSTSTRPDEAREMLLSDCSRATGALMYTSYDCYGASFWWLRSPYPYDKDNCTSGIVGDGFVGGGNYVSDDCFGVVPSLRIRLET